MLRRFLQTLLVSLASVSALLAADTASTEAALDKTVLPLVEKYCMDCHDNDTKKGDLSLEILHGASAARLDIRIWDKVREQIKIGEMPPEKKPQPSAEEKKAILEWISGAETALRSMPQADPGTHRTRRLTRHEYDYTLRDLLGISGHPAENWPSDGAGGEGFENNADTLFLSTLLVEKFLASADTALKETFAKPELKGRILAPLAGQPPQGLTSATVVFRSFLPRAYRRVITDEDVAEIAKVFSDATTRGLPFDDALKASLKGVLCSPKFLLLQEATRTGSKQPGKLTDAEIAQRLSYFLWSSMPDDELFRLAKEGKLQDDNVLAGQVKRMLADPKAVALTRHFAAAWLRFEELFNSVDPDRRKFPDWNDNLRHAMYDEAFEFCDQLLRKNGRALEILEADYTFVNEPLARLYGIPNVQGPQMRRVTLPDARRGGVLGMGAVLASTAYPQRTSPVLRGKWVLETLLGTPPPPPPMNVSKLPEDNEAKKDTTLRQKLEAHRKDPACAGCHRRLDPPGFGLENFDGIGKWRDSDNGKPVDASGSLPDGQSFNGPQELRRVLLGEKDKFTRTVCSRLLGYALGRGLEPADQPTLLKLEEVLRKNDYRMEPLIVALVQSYPFRWRR